MLSKICVSVAGNTLSEIKAVLTKYDFAEIRLDLCNIDNNEIQQLFATQNKQFIATCRQGKYTVNERLQRLTTAIQSGAAYVDIEADEPEDYQNQLIDTAKRMGCKIIMSHHNFENTPDSCELDKIIAKCRSFGADIVKMVTTANSATDNAKILSLYTKHNNIIAFCMGNIGQITRLACLYLGAPFTYAAVTKNKQLASGQLDAQTLQNLINLLPLYYE